MLETILQQYGFHPQSTTIAPIGNGLINTTWKLNTTEGSFILQKINKAVFSKPEQIAENIENIANYLQQKFPDYLYVRPIATKNNAQTIVNHEHEYYRLFPFINNSVTYDVVSSPQLAYEAAKQFGNFSANLAQFPTGVLHNTIPDFHNLTLRFSQFKTALAAAEAGRLQKASSSISVIQAHQWIVDEYEKIRHSGTIKHTVVHHDTKISNVLFNNSGMGICVIDPDTTMNGYFISDLGDIFRTYLSPVSEEETDFTKIHIRPEYVHAVLDGYLAEMKYILSPNELKYCVYAGEFMIFMQAVRFLTDYLSNDVYYGQKYEGHNLCRANNQLVLLQKLAAQKESINQKVKTYL